MEFANKAPDVGSEAIEDSVNSSANDPNFLEWTGFKIPPILSNTLPSEFYLNLSFNWTDFQNLLALIRRPYLPGVWD